MSLKEIVENGCGNVLNFNINIPLEHVIAGARNHVTVYGHLQKKLLKLITS